MFDGSNKIACFQEAFMGSRVKPCHAAAEELHFEFVLIQVYAVQVRDFQFASGGWLQVLGNLHDVAVVKIETDDGVVGLVLGRFLFQADGLSGFIEGYNAVTLRILHPVTEDEGTVGELARFFEHFGEAVAVEDVVAKDEADVILTDEIFADDEGLGKAAGAGLLGIREAEAELGAFAQKFPIKGQIPRRRNNQDVPDPGKHQYRQRIVDHGLVEDREKLFGDGFCNGVQACSCATRENDAFNYKSFCVGRENCSPLGAVED